ncbi:DNA-binding transcriptional LysR family regulator [Bradyrhizobium sp. USDA 4463]
MDTIASKRGFIAVAKTGSFSRAAEQLDLVSSVATKKVTQLEQLVGVTPLHHTTRKVTLSPEDEHHFERFVAPSHCTIK